MAQNKIVRFGPVAMATSATNIINPGTTNATIGLAGSTPNLYVIVRHIRLVNKTSGGVSVSFYVGLTGGSLAGTEFLGNALSVPPNSYIDWYGLLRLDNADFLTGLQTTGSAGQIVFEAEGEIGVA